MLLRSKAPTSIEERLEPFDRDWNPDDGWIIEEHEGQLRGIEDLVKAIQRSSGPAWLITFENERWKAAPTAFAKKHLHRLPSLLEIDDLRRIKQIRFSERFYLFAQACDEIRQLGYTALGCTSRERGALLLRYQAQNAWVDNLRAKTRDRAFRDRCRHREALEAKHAAIGKAFVDRAFAQHSKLLVVRVDLSYSLEAIPTMTLEQVRQDLLRLWQLRHQAGRKVDKDPFVGYARGIEFRVKKWFHVHVTLLLNGQEANKDYFYGEQLGQLWQQATGGRGIYFNCSVKRARYEYLYLGVIDAADAEKREWLLTYGVSYLAKNELYMPVITAPLRRYQTSQLRRVKGRGGRNRLPVEQRLSLAGVTKGPKKRGSKKKGRSGLNARASAEAR